MRHGGAIICTQTGISVYKKTKHQMLKQLEIPSSPVISPYLNTRAKMLTTGCHQAPVSSVYLSSPYGLSALCVSAAGVEMPLAPHREFCDSWIICFGWFVERGVKRDLQMMSRA